MLRQFETYIYRLKRIYHFFKTGLLRGLVGQIKFQFPASKLKIITITGTDGKTTSSSLLYHLLKSSGKKVGLISTVAAYIGDDQIDTGFHVTTPDPFLVQKLLRNMVNQGVEYVVIEVTSHGEYQFRTWGIRPLLAGLTNITHEHLDYHLTYDLYVQTKVWSLKKAKTIVVNADDQSFAKIKKSINFKRKEVITYSALDPIFSQVSGAIKRRFIQHYNQMNARLVYALSQKLEISNKDFIMAMQSFPTVPGRMQEVENKKGIRVIVDFAHTPNGLESALSALKKEVPKGKKLIAVFGCAGLRDHQKRPMMGKIGVDIADLVVFTAEDPRTEDIWSIIRQMKEQLITGHDRIVSIADRKQAITFALTKLAQKGDIVALLGKGHEKSLCYGLIEYPWSDQVVAEEILKSI